MCKRETKSATNGHTASKEYYQNCSSIIPNAIKPLNFP